MSSKSFAILPFFFMILCACSFGQDLCDRAMEAISGTSDPAEVPNNVIQAVIDHGRLQVTQREFLGGNHPIERIIASEYDGYGLVAPMDSQIWWGINPPLREETAWALLTPDQRVEVMRQFALNLNGGNYTHKIIPWLDSKEGVGRRLLGNELYDVINSHLHRDTLMRKILDTVPGDLLMLAARNPLNVIHDTTSNPRHLKMLQKKLSSPEAVEAMERKAPRGFSPSAFYFLASGKDGGFGVCTERATASVLLAIELGAKPGEVQVDHGGSAKFHQTHTWASVLGVEGMESPESLSDGYPLFRRKAVPGLLVPLLYVEPVTNKVRFPSQSVVAE